MDNDTPRDAARDAPRDGAARDTPADAARRTAPGAPLRAAVKDHAPPPDVASATPPEAARATPPEAARATPPEAARATAMEAARATAPEAAGDPPPDAAGGAAPAVARQKAAMRARLRAARAAMTPGERSAAGRALRDAVLSLPETQMAGTVAAYFSVGAEPDTKELIYALWKRGSYVLLPLLRDDWDLDWASYEGPDSVRLRPDGRYGLAEPTQPPRGPGAIARAALVIVPALAVDGRGTRLGQGGGCYDRALARVSAAVPTVALVYENELVRRVPSVPHDQTVRLVARSRAGTAELLRLPLQPASSPHQTPPSGGYI